MVVRDKVVQGRNGQHGSPYENLQGSQLRHRRHHGAATGGSSRILKERFVWRKINVIFSRRKTSGLKLRIRFLDATCPSISKSSLFDDGNDGSPMIAMQIINERLGMSRISRKNNAIVPCFIELNHAADLEQNLMLHPYQYGTPQVVDGKFEDNIRGLLKDKRGYNVFLYIDPYGIQALDSQLFDEIGTYGFRSFEMLINFNSFGFFRDACRVMKVDISQDDALMGLDDLVEYEPTTVTASPQSENLLTRIAGGNYWMDIVRDFQMGRIDGYQAERRLSAEYKQHLKQKYKYVLDMPIRLKPGQRPKYRMIHVCDHEDGCFLMAENMQRRKDELFVNIQQNGQLSLFNMMSTVTSTVENDILTQEEIEQMVLAHIHQMTSETHITVFLADFCNEYGVICPFRMIYEILTKLENAGTIDIVRDPALTAAGKKRMFWEEKAGQTVIVRRHT